MLVNMSKTSHNTEKTKTKELCFPAKTKDGKGGKGNRKEDRQIANHTTHQTRSPFLCILPNLTTFFSFKTLWVILGSLCLNQ